MEWERVGDGVSGIIKIGADFVVERKHLISYDIQQIRRVAKNNLARVLAEEISKGFDDLPIEYTEKFDNLTGDLICKAILYIGKR